LHTPHWPARTFDFEKGSEYGFAWGGWPCQTRRKHCPKVPKAIQETAKLGGKAIDAGSRLGGWLDRIFGPLIEDAVGLHWSDRVRARRVEAAIYDWERLETLLHKVAARLKAQGVDTTRVVPPKVALPLIENATMEGDDDLRTLWANLLANGLDPSAGEIEKNMFQRFPNSRAEMQRFS